MGCGASSQTQPAPENAKNAPQSQEGAVSNAASTKDTNTTAAKTNDSAQPVEGEVKAARQEGEPAAGKDGLASPEEGVPVAAEAVAVAPPKVEKVPKEPATFHEPGKPYIRLVLPHSLYEELLGRADELKVHVECLEGAPGATERVVDISATSHETLMSLMPDLMEKIMRHEQMEMEQTAIKKQEIEKEKARLLQEAADMKRKEAEEKDAKAKAAKEAEKKKGPPLPKAEFGADNNIEIFFDEKSSEVPLKFKWSTVPSAFNEVTDEEGKNWGSKGTGIRKSKGTPKSIALEWRRGMTGEWNTLKANEQGQVEMTYKPETIGVTKLYRGFQSRWVIDGERYLTPIEPAPSLTYKLMQYDTVASALNNLPEDKRNIHGLPDNDLKKGLIAVENIIPMNTWDIDLGVEQVPGLFIDGEHAMTTMQNIKFQAAQKVFNDPKMLSEVRRAALKMPVQATVGLLGAVGIPLKAIVPDLDFFLPKHTEPDFDALEKLEQNYVAHELERRDKQRIMNQTFPEWMNGLRVVLPPASDLRLAAQTKRPALGQFAPQIKFRHVFNDKKQYNSEHDVKIHLWTLGDEKQQKQEWTVQLKGVAPKREGKPVKAYESDGALQLETGSYAYHWLIDGQAYCDEGIKVSDDRLKAGTMYSKFNVKSRVVFGIGVDTV